jgi:hypothetical protein
MLGATHLHEEPDRDQYGQHGDGDQHPYHDFHRSLSFDPSALDGTVRQG